MKKSVVLAVVFAFAVFVAMGTTASADDLIPGAYAQQDQSVMGVGQTMVQMGANQRALTDAVNRASRADRSRNSSSGVNVDYQFGSSQSDNSWKAAKTVEEAQVPGLVPGDCSGDNTTDAYRKQMGQSRDGYMKEALVPNNVCGDYHPTLK
ncbi:MAG: hypothetical protein ACE5E9_08635 [Nitrospinaceae bacterium]